MPIVPLDYPGLQTSLADMWIDKEEEKEDDGDAMSETTKMVLIIVGSSVVGTILLCCLGYYIVTFCANRMNKVTYDQKDKNQTTKIVIKDEKALELQEQRNSPEALPARQDKKLSDKEIDGD